LNIGDLIRALEAQIAEAERLKSKRYDCSELIGWIAKTKALIRRADEPDFLEQFERLSFRSSVSVIGESDSDRLARNQPVYEAGLAKAQGILRGLIEVLQIPGSQTRPRKKPSIGFLKEDES